MYYPLTQVDLPTPTKADNTFKGWYTNPAFLGEPVTSVMMDRDRTVYAKWEEVVYMDKVRLVISLYNDSPRRQEVIAHEPYYLTQVDDRGTIIKKTEHKYDGFTDSSTSKWFDEVEVPRGKYILRSDDGKILGQVQTSMELTKIEIQTRADQSQYTFWNTALYERKDMYCVLYSSRMLVINEDIQDREANKANYGYVVREMAALTEENDWTPEWKSDSYDESAINMRIKKVKFGTQVKPKNMRYWFYCNRNLTEINTTGLDTSDCESFYCTWSQCRNFSGCDIRGWGTNKVTNIGSAFAGCQKWLDLCEQVNTWDTSNVWQFSGAFGNLTLEEIHLTIDTSSATWMSATFAYAVGTKVIDIPNFDTSNVEEFPHMFGSCHELETIKVGPNFVPPAGSNSPNMFLDCFALVGGNGTTYNAAKITGEMAHIDTAENPGYFTAAT